MSHPTRLLSTVVVVALTATACVGSGASRESLVEILEAETELDRTQVQCVADEVYSSPDLTEEEINSFATVSSVDADSPDAEKFEIYNRAVDAAIETCVT